MGAGSSRPDGSDGEDLDTLVHKIVSKEFDIDALKLNHNFIDITKEVVDETRPLKNVATDLVVNEFFKTEDTLYRFLHYVYTMFEDAISIYCRVRGIAEGRIFFLYKGGNILRIISREFLLELPSSATKEIAQFYSQFFQRSDADFSIYVDPTLKPYDEIYHEITLLAYLVQDKIRDHFHAHLMTYFNFFQYNAVYQSEVLFPYLGKFNESLSSMTQSDEDQVVDPFVNFGIGDAVAILDGPKVSYQANNDVTIRFVNLDEDWKSPVRKSAIGVIERAPPGRLMTITHNSSLDFPGGTFDIRQRFNLTRTKFIFTLLRQSGRRQNVGGELIDVSIPHRQDTKLPVFFKNLKHDISRYTLRLGDGEFKFNAFSLPYLTYDLEDVLFNQKFYPWLDKKYAKRINRLMYLYFIDIFIILENAPEKLQVLRDVREWVFKPMTKPEISPRSIAKRIVNFSRYSPRGLAIEALMVELLKLMKKVEDDPSQAPEMQKLGQVLVENTDFLIRTITNVRQYCSVRDGKIERRDLYDAGMESLS